MVVKRLQTIQTLVRLIGLLFGPLPLGPGQLGYDGSHAEVFTYVQGMVFSGLENIRNI